MLYHNVKIISEGGGWDFPVVPSHPVDKTLLGQNTTLTLTTK